jgi:hypothetical protein
MACTTARMDLPKRLVELRANEEMQVQALLV